MHSINWPWHTNYLNKEISITILLVLHNVYFQADSIFNEPMGERPLRDRLMDTAELTNQVLELTAPGRGASLLPVDLNSTNAVIDGIVDLLDATLDTTENVTDLSDQV